VQAELRKSTVSRNQHAIKKGHAVASLAEARANNPSLSIRGDAAAGQPKFIGRRVFKNIDLA